MESGETEKRVGELVAWIQGTGSEIGGRSSPLEHRQMQMARRIDGKEGFYAPSEGGAV
jgi:hypothetical protein